MRRKDAYPYEYMKNYKNLKRHSSHQKECILQQAEHERNKLK